MKKFLYLLPMLMLTFLVQSALAQSPVGKWRTIDDEEQGKEKSIVKLYENEGVIYGVVEKLTDPKAKRVCDSCSGDKKNKPIEGMQILWGLKKTGKEWGDGYILDPKNGKVYKAKVWVEGQNLKVRGYIGPFFRTQTWYPVK